MAQTNVSENISRTETRANQKRLGHWIRVGVMFLSGGFIFPHAMTEDEDAAKPTATK